MAITFTDLLLINKLIDRMWAGFLNSHNTAGLSEKWKCDTLNKFRKLNILETTFEDSPRQTT